jgi:hypothetical protein
MEMIFGKRLKNTGNQRGEDPAGGGVDWGVGSFLGLNSLSKKLLFSEDSIFGDFWETFPRSSASGFISGCTSDAAFFFAGFAAGSAWSAVSRSACDSAPNTGPVL